MRRSLLRFAPVAVFAAAVLALAGPAWATSPNAPGFFTILDATNACTWGTPYLGAIFSDPDGGTGHVEYTITENGTVVVSGSGATVNSGQQSRWLVPSGYLIPYHVYTASAVAVDQTGARTPGFTTRRYIPSDDTTISNLNSVGSGGKVVGPTVCDANTATGNDEHQKFANNGFTAYVGGYAGSGGQNYPKSAASVSIRYTQHPVSNCSGSLIGPDTVVTAGHCLYNELFTENGGFALLSELQVLLNARGANSSPYPACAARSYLLTRGFVEHADENADYGVIKLASTCKIGGKPPGTYLGYLAFAATSADLTGQTATITANGPDRNASLPQTFNVVFHDDNVDNAGTPGDPRRSYFSGTIEPGDSGSPVYMNGYGGCQNTLDSHSPWCLMAIVTEIPPDLPYNAGTRISMPVFWNLSNWKNCSNSVPC